VLSPSPPPVNESSHKKEVSRELKVYCYMLKIVRHGERNGPPSTTCSDDDDATCCATYVLHYNSYNRFTALWMLSGTTRMSQYQKGKTNLDLLEQNIVNGSGIYWAICKSAPNPRQITTPALPTAQPTAAKH